MGGQTERLKARANTKALLTSVLGRLVIIQMPNSKPSHLIDREKVSEKNQKTCTGI